VGWNGPSNDAAIVFNVPLTEMKRVPGTDVYVTYEVYVDNLVQVVFVKDFD